MRVVEHVAQAMHRSGRIERQMSRARVLDGERGGGGRGSTAERHGDGRAGTRASRHERTGQVLDSVGELGVGQRLAVGVERRCVGSSLGLSTQQFRQARAHRAFSDSAQQVLSSARRQQVVRRDRCLPAG